VTPTSLGKIGTAAPLPAIPKSRTQAKIAGFRELQVGWHYGEGGPINDAAIARADEVLSFLTLIGLTHTDAFAGAGGEILLTVYHGDHCLEVMIEPDGCFGLTHERAGQEMCDHEAIDLAELKSKLLEVASEIWRSSASFIQSTLITCAGGSLASASRTLEAASRLSVGNVSMLPAWASAITLEGSTPM
jgi:hypothetical protein